MAEVHIKYSYIICGWTVTDDFLLKVNLSTVRDRIAICGLITILRKQTMV